MQNIIVFVTAKADEALKAKERNEEEAKRRKEEGKSLCSFFHPRNHCLT
jgi:hypothetical protein